MLRPLRAPRYNHNPALAEFIETKLFGLDLQDTIEFYTRVIASKSVDDMALLGCNDRFFLLSQLLNRKDILNEWLFDRCREVEVAPDGFLDLWARFHYKSSIITFAGIIQEILVDPNIAVAIFSHTQPIAKAFLEQIKRELEDNVRLKRVYDDVLWENPRTEAPKWSSEEGIIIKRTANPREATVEAHGLVDNQPISRHYNLLVYDDVVTEKSVTTPEQIAKTTRMWELSDNLSTHEGARKWHAGTRYCTVGSMKVLMVDWSHKPISDVRIGDSIVGWELRDGKRWLRPARVINRGMHFTQPVKRYVFDNGRSVTSTEDHRWWRGPHGGGPEYAPLALPAGKRADRLPRGQRVDGGLVHIRELLVPTECDDGRDAGWLAGFFDGEGHVSRNGPNQPSGSIHLTQTKGNGLLDEAKRVLKRLKFACSETWHTPPQENWKQRCVLHILGGWRERYRFLAQVAPARRDKIAESLFAQLKTSKLKLVRIEDAGAEDVHWLETETGNYVIEGFCSSNSFADTYGVILERKALKERRYPATDDGTLKGTPVFLTQQRWNEIKTSQRSTVSSQMLLNPVAGNDAIFLSEWFSAYEVFPNMMNVYILCDPSKGRKTSSRSSGSDRTAIAVIGIDAGGNKYLLDGYCHRMRLKERYDFIKHLFKKWSTFPGVQVVKVGYEQYGQQVDLEVFEEYMQRDGVYFEMEELNFPREGQHSKRHRVERLEPDVRTGRFLMPAMVYHPGVVPIDHNVGLDQTRSATLPNGSCLWTVWTMVDTEKALAAGKRAKDIHPIGQIIYRPARAITAKQRFCEKTQQNHRIVLPIRRVDEDGNVYDLTRVLMEEMRLFPAAPHDDLIDATARIFDIEPMMPVAHEAFSTDGSAEDELGIPIQG